MPSIGRSATPVSVGPTQLGSANALSIFSTASPSIRIGAQHHVLSLSYLDYAGDLLENAQQAGPAAFQQLNEHIGSAQTLLGMIDGEFLVRLLRNEATGHNYFEFEMRTMLGLLQEARCPIHLVISKWDLVHDFGEPEGADDQLRLAAAIAALRRFPHFESLLKYGAGRLIRIIPVSAVGPVFARYDPVGAVVKRPDGKVHPRNVEVPLCAVVPDLFRQVERQLDDERRREIAAMHAGTKFGTAEVLSGSRRILHQAGRCRAPGGDDGCGRR